MFIQNKEAPLIKSMEPYKKPVSPFAGELEVPNPKKKRKTKRHVSASDWSEYQNNPFLDQNSKSVLYCYLALSHETLKVFTNDYHYDSSFEYGRSISGQEDLIGKHLEKINVETIRQLLVGTKHCDFYLPRLHLCLEPSSERHFSTPRRANMEMYTLNQRYMMNQLHSVYINRYNPAELNQLSMEEPKSDDEVNYNLLTMAKQTMPYFIPYKELENIIKSAAL